MLIPVLLFIVGLLCLIKGGDWFVDGATGIARRFHVPELLIGATVVSIGTTLPEVMVSTTSALTGHGEIAYGNAIGSVICNTAMILAISIIFMPIAVDKRSFAPKGILLIAAVCALFLLSRSGSFSIAGAAVLLFIFLLYITENIRSAKRDAGAEETEEAPASDRKSIVLNILRIVGGAACIVVGSQLLVSNGSLIAASWGVSEAIIGVTIVAIGTSLPELVTAVTSLIKKQSSMSVGNVIGANVIDTTLILAVCSFVYGGKLPVSAQNIYLDFPVAIVVTLIAIIPTIVCRRFQRWQGVLMLAVYVAYLVVVTTGLDWYLALVA